MTIDEITVISASWEETVNSKTLQLFKGCEVVVGSIIFLPHVFTADIPEDHQIEPIQKIDLEPLRSIKRIMGYLTIQAWPFDDFEVFENLEVIDGYHELHKPGAGSGPGTIALFVSAGRNHHSRLT